MVSDRSTAFFKSARARRPFRRAEILGFFKHRLACTQRAVRDHAEQRANAAESTVEMLQTALDEIRGSSRWRIGGLVVVPLARIKRLFSG